MNINIKIKITWLLLVLLVGINSMFTLSCNKEETKAAKILPIVTTNELTDFTGTSVTCGGNITSDGGSPVIAKGVYWNTKSNVRSENFKTNEGKDTGNFVSIINNLIPNTTYYFTAYATTANGTKYGNEISLKTDVAPCFPQKNSFVINNSGDPAKNFSFTHAAYNGPNGNYVIQASVSGVTVEISFAKEPITGKYPTSTDFFEIEPGYCRIKSTISGTYYDTSENKDVYVIKTGKNKYKVTFCNMPFSFFTANCNITIE